MVSSVFLSETSSIRKNEYIKVSSAIYLPSNRKARVNILAISAPGPKGLEQITKYPKNEEEIRAFYCLALKIEDEIRRRWGQK